MNAFLFYHQVGGMCEKEMLIFCMVFQKHNYRFYCRAMVINRETFASWDICLCLKTFLVVKARGVLLAFSG